MSAADPFETDAAVSRCSSSLHRTIWKFPIKTTDLQTVEMPGGAEILSVADQGGQLTLWAIVWPKVQAEHRQIEIIGAGNPVPNDNEMNREIQREFIGTAFQGPFVWHVFERT